MMNDRRWISVKGTDSALWVTYEAPVHARVRASHGARASPPASAAAAAAASAAARSASAGPRSAPAAGLGLLRFALPFILSPASIDNYALRFKGPARELQVDQTLCRTCRASTGTRASTATV